MFNKGKEKSQQRPSKKRSNAWDGFTEVEQPDGNKKAKCNNCGELLSCNSKKHGTSHLWRHLKSVDCIESPNKDARTTLLSHSSGNRENQLGYVQQTNTETSGCQDNNLRENHLEYVQQINTKPSGNRENQLGYLQQTGTEPSGSQENNLGNNHLRYVQQTNTKPSGNRENQLGYIQQTNTETSGCQDNNLGENHLGFVHQINIEPSGNRENQLGYLQQTNTKLYGCQKNNFGENHLGYVQQKNTEPSGNRENQLGYLQQTDTEPSGFQENNLGENHLRYVEQVNTEPSRNRENQLEYDPQKNRELFVRMVIDNKSMLEHVENPFLEEFARFLQPSYSHVTRRDVEEDCLTFYKNEKAQLKEKITKLTSKVSLSVVSFYNPKDNCRLLCVAAHFIDNDYRLVKRIIGFVDFDAQVGFDAERILNDWGLGKKAFACTAEIVYFGSADKSSRTLDVKCILMCFRSIADRIYEIIGSDYYRIKRIMEHLNESPEQMCYFNRIAAEHNLAPKFEFRFKTIGVDLNILNDACTYKNVLCAFDDRNVRWSKVEQVVHLLNPINDLVVKLPSLEFPTSNLLLKYVFEISDVLLSEDSAVLSGHTKDAIDSLLDNYLDSCDKIVLIASLLDPRFKFKLLKRCIEKIQADEEDYCKFFCSLYDEYQSESTVTYRFDRLSQIPELNKYFERSLVEEGDANFDVLGWWKDSELEYPILSRMARDILAIPISSMLTSGTEPVQEIIDEIFYSTVDTGMSKVLVCCNNWLRSGSNAGKYVVAKENITEKRHLEQVFPEHSNNNNSGVYDQIKCQDLLAKLVMSSELPFNFVKSTWFIEWAKNLQPMYTPGNLASFKTKCLGFYQIERRRFKDLHAYENRFANSTLERYCFSVHKEEGTITEYICVTAHFIDNSFNLVRRIIATKSMNNWDRITEKVQRCIDKWDLPKKVLAFTTGIIHYESPQEILDGLTWGVGAIKLHCIVQGLFNELLRSLWHELDKVFGSIRKMIKFLVEAPKGTDTINQLAIKLKISSPKLYLQLDDKRRWDSTINMLSDALAYKVVFEAYKGYDESFPLCENWYEVESAFKLLKPIYEAVTILSSSQYPTSNLVLKIVFEIHDVLSHVVLETNNDYNKGEFLDRLMIIPDSYLKGCNNILLVASLLDPRFKSTYLERCYTEHISDREEIKKCIGDLCYREEISDREEIEIYLERCYREHISDREEIEHDKGLLELDRYLQEDHIEVRDGDFDVLRWWKENQDNYPILSRIARHILAIPVSSLPFELAFSTAWPFNRKFPRFGKLENQLGPNLLEALVCSNNWLSTASSNGKCAQKETAIDLVEKHIPPSYKCPLRACDFWSISFLKYGLSGRMSEEIVAIGGARLTVEKMHTLIKSIDEDGPDKWIPDDVINCYISIMNSKRSTSAKILKLTTFDSQKLQSLDEREKLHERNLSNIIQKGNSFLQNELVFLPIHEQNHWFVGALNASKKEFQILNSLNSGGDTYKETIQKLKLGIQVCIDAALDSQGTLQAWRSEINVLNWHISVISNLPQQKDGCSCGLFALKYMELWDGSKLATEFTQDDIDLFRKRLVGELIFSELNEMKDIQHEIKTRKLSSEKLAELEELDESENYAQLEEELEEELAELEE